MLTTKGALGNVGGPPGRRQAAEVYDNPIKSIRYFKKYGLE
jgi:hypothetical protein